MRGDQTVVGIAGSIPAFGEAGFVASLLQFQIENVALIVLSLTMHSFGLEGRLDRQRFYRAQQLTRNCGVNSRPAEGHASWQTHHQVRLVAAVDGPALRIAGIGDTQPPATSSASQETRQERPAAATRLDPAGAAVIVDSQLPLIALVFLPVNVAFVVVPDHHLPGSDWLAVPITAARPPVDDGRSLLALSIDIDTGIEGVLEDRDHIAVADRHPGEAGHATLIGWSREVNLIGCHRQQHLPRAAKVAEAGKDGPDHFLQTQVRIKSESGFAMPDVAERHRQAQFAPACLRPGGIEHSSSKHTQFELADAALHAQKQPIIGSTWIVDAVMVDDAGFDEATQFEQMMPVPTVAREPRGIEAQNGTNLAGA